MDAIKVALALLLCAFSIGSAQNKGQGLSDSTADLWPVGFVADSARAELFHAWDTTHTSQPERAYCVSRDSVAKDWAPAGYYAVYVLQVIPAKVRRADQMSIDATCGVMPLLHTHAEFCRESFWGPEPSTCSFDQPEAYQCQPSIPDMLMLMRDGHPYDLIQCGPHQFRFYWNFGLLKVPNNAAHQPTHSSIPSNGTQVPGARTSARTPGVSQPDNGGGQPGQPRGSHVETWLDRGRRRLFFLRRHHRGGGR